MLIVTVLGSYASLVSAGWDGSQIYANSKGTAGNEYTLFLYFLGEFRFQLAFAKPGELQVRCGWRGQGALGHQRQRQSLLQGDG